MNKIDVDYLLKQNRKLRMQLKQTKSMADLHKNALLKLTQNQTGMVQVLSQILRAGAHEHTRERLHDQVFTLQGQILVLEKIVSQTYDNQKQTYLLLVQQFKKLQEENSKLQLQLHKFFEKIGEVDYLSGLVTKYKEIASPSEFAMASKKQQEQLLDMLNMQREQIRRLGDEKDKLLRINHMKQEVQRKKDDIKNMTMMMLSDQKPETDYNKMILTELQQDESRIGQSMSQINVNRSVMNTTGNPLNTTLNFVKLQRELIKQVDENNYNEDSEDSVELQCPQLSILFPDKVQQIRCSRQQAKVPYLNMKRVRQLMAKREQKMKKEIEAEGHHVNPTNKIIQLQTELDITRKELTSQMLKFRQMQDDNRKMGQQIIELQTRNQLLIKASDNLANNYRNVYRDYQLCRSITSEVQRLLGRKIGSEKEVIGAREELSSVLLINKLTSQEGIEHDYVKKMVRNIFRDKPMFQTRTLSPP